jgi:hypothetical protein
VNLDFRISYPWIGDDSRNCGDEDMVVAAVHRCLPRSLDIKENSISWCSLRHLDLRKFSIQNRKWMRC